MIPRVRRSLVQKRHGLPIQCHMLSFKPHIRNPRHFLLTLAPIFLEKQRYGRCGVELRSVQGNLEHI